MSQRRPSNIWLVLTYLFQHRGLWERFHRTTNHWDFSKSNYRELEDYLEQQGDISSIVDLACSEGYFLRSMADTGRFERLVGVEISERVLRRAHHRVPEMTPVIYDLCGLLKPEPEVPASLREPCDVCVIGDVLYHIAPVGVPPWLYWSSLAHNWDLKRKRLFVDNCRNFARKLLVLSSHQEGPSVRSLVELLGFQRISAKYYALDLR